jgi:hypothetical protein
MAQPARPAPSRFGSLLLKAIRNTGSGASDSNAATKVPITVQAAAGQTADLAQFLDSNGVVIAKITAAGLLVLTAAASLADPFGLGPQVKVAHVKYDFAVDGGTIGVITLASNAIIPINAIVYGGYIISTTAPVGATATIGFGTLAGSSAASLKAATAIATYTLNGILPLVPVWTAGSAFKMTAAGAITMSIATANLTAGVIELDVFYQVAAN